MISDTVTVTVLITRCFLILPLVSGWTDNEEDDDEDDHLNDNRGEYPPPGDTDDSKEFEDEEDGENHSKESDTGTWTTCHNVYYFIS